MLVFVVDHLLVVLVLRLLLVELVLEVEDIDESQLERQLFNVQQLATL